MRPAGQRPVEKSFENTFSKPTVESLSPSATPSWPGVQIGVAKYALGQAGQLLRFFCFADSYALLSAECDTPGIESSIYIGVLRGYVRALVDPDPRRLNKLRQKIREELPSIRFTFSYLLRAP